MVNVKATVEQEKKDYLVGVVFEGEFAVGFFDLVVVCVFGDP
jgi:hypothetical protein